MKILTLFLFLVFSLSSYSQDLVTIKHTNYTTTFSKSLKYPIVVEWWETKDNVACPTPLKRKDQFQPDPQLLDDTNLISDYVGSGFDRGHMSPAASNLCSGDKVLTECFYFSNMSPQTHALNAGSWKLLEVETRAIATEKDSMHVWCGNIGELKKIGRVSVPTKCWKVIYIKKTKTFKAYLFINNTSKSDGIIDNEVSVLFISKLTGLTFK
jgi:endonuclease G